MTDWNPHSNVCPLCEGNATTAVVPGRYYVDVQCDRCGTFVIGADLPSELAVRVAHADMNLLGGYTRERWQLSAQRVAWG